MLLFHVFLMVFMKVLESSVLSFGMCGFVIVDISLAFVKHDCANARYGFCELEMVDFSLVL